MGARPNLERGGGGGRATRCNEGISQSHKWQPKLHFASRSWHICVTYGTQNLHRMRHSNMIIFNNDSFETLCTILRHLLTLPIMHSLNLLHGPAACLHQSWHKCNHMLRGMLKRNSRSTLERFYIAAHHVGILQSAGDSRFWICCAGLYDRPVQPEVPSGPVPRPIITVKRLISCPTYCSRLHVNQHMAEHLLPVLPESASIKVGIAVASLGTCC